MSEADAAVWVRKQIEDDGFRIDDNALRRLVELAGADLRRLTNEIKKLSAASMPEKKITVDLVVGLVQDANPLENFALTDAIVSGRGSRAMAVLKKLLDDGAEPIALLGLLSYNLRRLMTAKEMMHRGADRKEVERVLRMKYREQENFLAAARRADRSRLAGVFELIYKADLAMKTSLGGGGDQGTRMQIEVLVCELASAMSR
jgi:DNA polymerase-3 subunit delta